MKRYIILTLTLAIFSLNSYSQEIKEVDIKDYTLELKDGRLNLDIDVDLDELNVKTTKVVVLTPRIINGKDTLSLKSIGVYGRNRRIYYERNTEEKPTVAGDIDLKPAQTDNIVDYSASVSFQEWMDGCSVSLVRVDCGCCGDSQVISETKLVERFPIEPYYPELIYLRPHHEVAKTREISGSAFIDFPVSKTFINPTYRNNTAELAKITGTIDSVKMDKDITIKSIFIKGYASPESPYSNNAYLAEGRTEALKEYVESLYHFGEGFIKTAFEPEDWDGLERYVEASTLPHKEEILEAIHSDREPDKKEWYIKSTWKEEYRYLLENCYPALRHSDYSIEYEIRSYSDPLEIEKILLTAPQNLSLEEFYVLAQTYEPGSEQFHELFETAVRMYPDDPIANLNAANSAILKKDYRRALRYLANAEELPEAAYARGALEIYMDEPQAALPYLQQASGLGIEQADAALEELAINRYKITMTTNK